MNHEQFTDFKSEMKEHLETVLQAKVNGKIDKISVAMKENSDKLNDFIIRAEPAVKLFENLTWFKKVVIGIAVFVATIAAGMTVLQQGFGFINKLFNR